MDIRRIETLKKGNDAIGNRVRVKVVKNKMAPPFKQAEFDILFARGINREGCLLDLAVEDKLIERAGAWYSHQGTQIGQGRESAYQFLVAEPKIAQQIEAELRENHRVKYAPQENEADVDDVAGKSPEKIANPRVASTRVASAAVNPNPAAKLHQEPKRTVAPATVKVAKQGNQNPLPPPSIRMSSTAP